MLGAGGDALPDEHLDHHALKGRAQVGDALLARRHALARDALRDGGLEPREAHLEAAPQHGHGQLHRLRVALGREAVDDRSARVAEAEELGHLVVGLARRVVACLADQRHVAEGAHLVEGRVPAAREQGDVGPCGAGARCVLVTAQINGQEVPVEVVDAYDGQAAAVGDRLGGREPDEQRTDEARPLGHGDRIHVVEAVGQGGEGPFEHRDDGTQVGAGGELGNDPAVGRVQADLARHGVRQHQAVVTHHGGTRLVAAALDAEDLHVPHITGWRVSDHRPKNSQGALPSLPQPSLVRPMMRTSAPPS